MTSAQASLDDAVTLKECETVDLSQINSPSDYLAAASSSETLEHIEKVVQDWIKQIEQVIYSLETGLSQGMINSCCVVFCFVCLLDLCFILLQVLCYFVILRCVVIAMYMRFKDGSSVPTSFTLRGPAL